jgi:long-chain acyl-CoA synthetase
MVVGQDQKFLGAIIVPHLEAFKAAGVAVESIESLAGNESARALLDAEVRQMVGAETGFKSFERIGGWRLIAKPFEIGDELTATLKVRRHVITDKYAPLISEIYD